MNITAIILTKNEELHIGRCLESISKLANKIVVVDCGSTDQTINIAKKFNVEVLIHRWEGHGKQFNWALSQLPKETDWVIRIDADEYPTQELINQIRLKVSQLKKNIHGIYFIRRIKFQNKIIRFGGVGKIYSLRMFKYGYGKSETILQDEHIIVSGNTIKLKGLLIDENLNSLDWWIAKHNKYSSNEVFQMLKNKYERKKTRKLNFNVFVKENIYSKFPTGTRAILYFFLRYIVLLGFLDGSPGFKFHFFQGFWYRFLIDAKFSEVIKYMEITNASYKKAALTKLSVNVADD
jgi:glycosyltransferase involved in cell wall biosynthesis